MIAGIIPYYTRSAFGGGSSDAQVQDRCFPSHTYRSVSADVSSGDFKKGRIIQRLRMKTA